MVSFVSEFLIDKNAKLLHYGNKSFKVKELRNIVLFVVSGSIKMLSSFDCVNIYLFSIFFSIDFARRKIVGFTQQSLYRDSLTSNQ